MLQENLTLHTDKYQINMMYAYWKKGVHNNKSVFEAFLENSLSTMALQFLPGLRESSTTLITCVSTRTI